ncbi:MAG: NAD(P)/FAD-dependent oxidoreductase [Candidatus Eremiobacteraeota bacterium]|nr:NAD(P)/FAD-dependent oxidoreductase [Candidatus Eremiobacteraeota bacterium]
MPTKQAKKKSKPRAAMKAEPYEVLIVGGGAAGLNAALILGRARRSVLLCDDGHPRNSVAKHMHGFLSRDGTPPQKLLELARSELQRYPSVKLVRLRIDRAKVIKAAFALTAENGQLFIGKRLLLAYGVRDKLPDIEGLAKFWGRSVFVCPFCDGWEVRDRAVVVYGKGKEAVDLAQELYGWTKRVVVCVENGTVLTRMQRRWLQLTNCRLIEGRLRRLIGGLRSLKSVEVENRERLSCDALFLATPLRQTCAIAEALGCKLDKMGSIVVDDKCRTNVRGCYAAGDAVTDVHQVILAAASGVRAAVASCTDLLSEEARAITAKSPRRNGA